MPKYDPLRPLADIIRDTGNKLAQAEAFWGMGRKAPQAPQSDPVKASPVDFAVLAAELRKARKPRQALLVEYMADKPKAAVEDVAKDVHDNRHTNEKTIRENARQTSVSLAILGARLSFRVISGWLFREISPK